MKYKLNLLLFNSNCSCLFIIAVIIICFCGCGKIDEAKQIIAEHNTLEIELQRIEAQKEITINNIKNIDSRLNEFIRSKNKVVNRYEDLKEEISDFLMNHKMAVTSIISGVGGFAAQLADESELSNEAKGIAGMIGIIGGAYALFNWDEIEYVGSKMIRFSQKEENYKSRIAKYNRQINDTSRDLQDKKFSLKRIERKISNITLKRNELMESKKSNPLINILITIINEVDKLKKRKY